MLRRDKKKLEGARVTALVVEAVAPFDNKVNLLAAHRAITILVDAGSGPTLVARELHLHPDQWLFTGMEVPVVIDARRPEEFEVDWDAIPSIEDRVAANDPTLSDPVGAQRKVADALGAAGVTPPPRFGKVNPDRFKEALAKAAEEPVPAGKERGVAILVSATATSLKDEDGDDMTKVSGTHHAVLAVTVPGRDPYAVYKPKFKIPNRMLGITGGGVPALVSSSDPTDVAIEWDTLGSFTDQLGARMAESMGAASATQADVMAAHQQRLAAAMQNVPGAGAAPAAGATAAPGAMPASGLTPEMKKMMADNAKLALSSVTDPAMRQMLIDQYKLAGIPVEDLEAG
jgi:hypothetical protein